MRYWVKVSGKDASLIRSVLKVYENTSILREIAFNQSRVRSIRSLELTSDNVTFELEAQTNPFMELVELLQSFNANMVVSWKYGVGIFDDAGIRKAELTQEEIDSIDKSDQYEVQIQNMLSDKLEKPLRDN